MEYAINVHVPFLCSTACACHSTGSADPMCDQMTGQCNCMPNVTGLKCDICISSHYNIGSSAGCMPCQCDAIGSQSSECDIQSGECNCEPGVAGPFCDQCLEGYYGFSADGCTGKLLCGNYEAANRYIQKAVTVT